MSFACFASAARTAGSQLSAESGFAVSGRATVFRLAAARGTDTFFFGPTVLSADSVGVFRGRGSVGLLLLVSYYKIVATVPTFFAVILGPTRLRVYVFTPLDPSAFRLQSR